jgi:double-stranded uracil-DNA glycosylase
MNAAIGEFSFCWNRFSVSTEKTILRDCLAPDLDVVFCGTAAGNRSAERGHYYAGAGNKFWPTLYAVGLTSLCLTPNEDFRVLEFRIGLTDLVKHHSGNDGSLAHDMYDVAGFEERILEFAPRYVAFNGKESAAVYLGKKTRCVPYGLLQEHKIGQTRIFVLPSTSGSARRYWDENEWRKLADLSKRGCDEMGLKYE